MMLKRLLAFWVGVTLCLTLGFVSPLSANAQTQPANDPIKLGYEALKSDNWAEAEKQFKHALSTKTSQLPPEAVGSLNQMIGYALQHQQKFAEAIPYYEKALLSKQSAPPAETARLQAAIGYAKELTQDYTGAIAAYEQSVKQFILANDTEGATGVTNNLGSVAHKLHKSDRPTEALAALNLAQDYLATLQKETSKENIYTYILKGEILQQQKDYGASRLSYEKAYTLTHRINEYDAAIWPSTLYNLGQVSMMDKQYGQAKAAFKELLSYNKAFPINQPGMLKNASTLLQELSTIDTGSNYVNQLEKRFHRWNDKKPEIVIYITPGHDVPNWKPELEPLIKEAFAEWQGVFDNRFRFIYTDNPKKYDVKVLWFDKQPKDAKSETALGQNYTELWDKYISKSEIHIFMNSDNGKALSPDLFYGVILHEIGHLIGLEHSPNPDDVMYKRATEEPGKKHLTSRDKETALALYSKKPAFTNPDGIFLSDFSKFQKKQMQDMDCDNVPTVVMNFDTGAIEQQDSGKQICRKRSPFDQIPIYMQY